MAQLSWIQWKISNYEVNYHPKRKLPLLNTNSFSAIRILLRGKAHAEWKVMLSGDRRTVINRKMASLILIMIYLHIGKRRSVFY